MKRITVLVYLLTLIFLCQAAITGSCDETEGSNTSKTQTSSVSVDPIRQTDGFSAVLYDNTHGLPTSEANAIAQTEEGFIWIGGYSGLVRYDGSNFERYDSTHGITTVKCLFVDSKDRLWVGTNDNGLAMLDHGSVYRWCIEDGLTASSVRSIIEDSSGIVYAATTSGITVIDHDLNISALDDPQISGKFIHQLDLGADELIYGLTNEGDIFTLKNSKVVDFLSFSASPVKGISCIFPDPLNPGFLYLEGENSEVFYSDFRKKLAEREKIDISPLTFVQQFNYINDEIWICARNGIGVLDGREFTPLNDVPMNNSVGSMMVDYEGNFWFTSTRQGVMKIVPNQFHALFPKYNLSETVVNSTCMGDDKLFIGADTGLIVIDDTGEVKNLPLKSAKTASGEDLGTDDLIEYLDGVRIRSIIRDSKGRLWFSTWLKYGLLRYDNGDLTAFTEKEGLFSDRVRAVRERSDGSILVAITGGVNVIDGDKVIASYGEADGILNTETLTVEEGKNGDIILGSDGGGIFIITDNGVKHIGRDEGLTSEAVMRVKYDPAHDIYWVVTGSSIEYLSSGYKLTTLNKFPYSNNFDLYENEHGDIWVLSSNGIYVASAQQMLVSNEDDEIETFHYSLSNGLPCVATANSYSELTADGDLYISGNSGVTKVNIINKHENWSSLKAAVAYVDVDGTLVYPDSDGNFSIGHNVQKLTVYGFVYNYSLTDPQITYCLEGFDKKEITLSRSDLAPVVYTNIPGGTYTFRMTIKDSLGNDSKSISAVITKEKALYEYIWFYIVLGVITVLILTVCVKIYIRNKMSALEKKHQEEKERERINNELKVAFDIQSSMLPKDLPSFPGKEKFDISAKMDPAKEVGGDFYDYFLIDDDHLGMVIADVSGKGVPAALFMMISKVILKNCAMLGQSAAEVLTKTNESLCSNNQVDMFVTVWFGIMEISTGKITAANAGHEYPAIMKNGKFELLKDKHGFVLGGMDGVRYREYEIQLEPGDKLFLYTDGVPEATDANAHLFGTDNMIAALNEDPTASPDCILKNVRKAVDGFVKEAEQFDDLTMLCVQRND